MATKKKILFEDDFLSLTKSGEFLVCSIKNAVKKFTTSYDSFYFSDNAEFEEFKRRFEGVYEILKSKNDEAWHMTCKYAKYIESTSCELDVRHKLTNEEIAEVIFKNYFKEKKEAIKELNVLIKSEKKGLRVEEKIDQTAKAFNLEEQFKDHIGYPEHDKRFNALLKGTDDILTMLRELNSKDK